MRPGTGPWDLDRQFTLKKKKVCALFFSEKTEEPQTVLFHDIPPARASFPTMPRTTVCACPATLCPVVTSKPTKYRRRGAYFPGSSPTSLQLRKWWEPVSSAQDWKPEITLEAETPNARSQGLVWRTFCSAENIIPEAEISSFKSRGAMQKWAVPHKKPCEFPVTRSGPHLSWS